MITTSQLRVKRCFDFFLAAILLPLLIVPIAFLVVIAAIDTKQSGIFKQIRVGQHAKLFCIYKIRSIKDEVNNLGVSRTKITPFGAFLRRSKLDELPQVINVLIGDMSFVGPRPDLEGFADVLEGEDRILLLVKPGITGPATLKYKNEERVLERQNNPEHYNRTIIWVDKVKINRIYVSNYSFYLDLKFILKSILNR